MEFQPQLKKRVDEVENIIKKYMPEKEGLQKTVLEAMDYTMSAGGKRIRPVLMKAVFDMFMGDEADNDRDEVSLMSYELIEPFMAAIEMIHTYSLIHDDLPALDNDDYRRGRKTAHVVYGEDIAILAGDGLLNYAYETACRACDVIDGHFRDDIDKASAYRELILRRRVEKALTILAANPGINGMIGGQTVDVELTGRRLTEEQLIYIYMNKTGALIDAAMTIGAVLAGASDDLVEKISETAYNIGMAFQIQDDILDETATFEELGKPIHSDKDSGKVTYVTIYGLDKSRKKVCELSDKAVDTIEKVGNASDSGFLVEMIRYLIDRTS